MKKETKFAGSTPERFMNRNVSVCPICGSSEPRWTIDSREDAGLRFLFKCESCASVLSAFETDIHKWNRQMLATVGCSDIFIRKQREQIMLKVEKIRGRKLTRADENRDFSLKDIKSLARSLAGCIEEAPRLQ